MLSAVSSDMQVSPVDSHGGKYIAYSASRFAKIVDTIQKVALENGKRVPMIYG